MGIQILNKDVSVISRVTNIAKANIGSIFGKTGWSGGADVTPNPTPDWTDNTSANPVDSSTVQIQGIDTPITLSMNLVFNSDGGTLTVGVNTSNSYGGTITTYTSEPTNFIVNPNEYVTFRWEGDFFEYAVVFDVKNISDNNTLLDTVTLVRESFGGG